MCIRDRLICIFESTGVVHDFFVAVNVSIMGADNAVCLLYTSFFVVGREGTDAEEALQRIVEDGHTLGMHSYRHNP